MKILFMLTQHFSWDEIHTYPVLAHTPEAFLIRLSPLLCMKIYSPQYKQKALAEYRNLSLMHAAGL